MPATLWKGRLAALAIACRREHGDPVWSLAHRGESASEYHDRLHREGYIVRRVEMLDAIDGVPERVARDLFHMLDSGHAITVHGCVVKPLEPCVGCDMCRSNRPTAT